MAYLRSLSGGRSAPWWQWVVALAAGWASTELTLFVSKAFGVSALMSIPYLGSLVFFVLGVGLVEEGAKAICALLALKLPGLVREPLFALQLCCGVGLGFATAENIIYAQNYGDSVLVGRFVFSTLGHLLFVSLWGFALGGRWVFNSQSKEYERRTPWFRFLGFLLLSALAHGLFDWFLMTSRPILAILTLVVLWLGFREATLGAFLRQEYQRELPFPMMSCPSCEVLTRAEGRYCSFCGNLLAESEVEASEPELLEQ